MKVLHVHSGNVFGGIERIFVTLARQESINPSMRHHFALSFEGQLSEELRRGGSPVLSLGPVRIRNLFAVLAARHKLKRIIDDLRPHVIISHAAWAQVVFGSVIKSSKLPYVFWLHDAIEHVNRIERLARRTRPDRIICNSSFTASKLPNLYPDCPNEVIYSPVDLDVQCTRCRQSVRTEFGANGDSVVIAMTSRLEPWKGHELLLESLSKLDVNHKWECWIAGGVQREHEKTYLRRLETLVTKRQLAKRVKFLGHVRDIYSVLNASDVHCQPNLGPEPFGIAFIEALACGLPVVTTRIGAAAAIVDESCGILVNPNDPDGLTTALTEMIRNAPFRKRLSSAAPGRAHLLCDPDRQIRKLHTFLAETAATMAARS